MPSPYSCNDSVLSLLIVGHGTPNLRRLLCKQTAPSRSASTPWKKETGLVNWGIGLTEIARVHNHSRHSAIRMKPFEPHFNAKSSYSDQYVKPKDRAYLRLECDSKNTPTPLILLLGRQSLRHG
jgi:hypothetical protein